MSYVLAALLCVLVSAQARAEYRVALIIGNSKYQDKSLAAPARNLKAVAAEFAKLGFQTKIGEDLDEKKLRYAIEGFAGSLTRDTGIPT